MKKNAFTLVELLAVIIVIAIVLVIAVPRLTNISGGAEKEKFKINSNEIYNLVKSDFLSYHGGTLSSDSIMYTVSSMEIKDGSRVLDTKLKENIDGYVEVDSSGASKALLENDKFCMIKEYADTNLKIYPIDSSECTMTGKVLFVFNLNGGELVDSSFSLTGTYSPNTQLSYPSIKKEGYALRKWQLEKGDAVLGEDYITIGNKNSTITAMWGKEVNLTVELDGGILSDSLHSVYAEGSEVILPSPTKTDYVFTGWKVVSGNAIISGNTLHFGTTDVTIKATYGLNTSNLVLDFDGGDTSGDVSGTYTINEKVTLPSPTKTGYDFAGWEVVSGNSVLSGNVIIIGNQNTKVKATYKLKKYVVTLNATGGEISSNTLDVTYGKPYENLPTPTRQYYNFLGWYTDSGGGELVNNTDLVSIAANHVLYARWESSLLDVTYEYLVNNYSCAGTTKGTPVFTYTGNCEIVSNGEDGWKIKYLSSGTLTLSSEIGVDLFLVGGGGGGSGSAGGGGGYTKTYLNQVIEAGAYNLQVGAQVTSGNSGNKSYFGDDSKYVAFGGNAGGNGNGGSGGSGGGGRGGTCCVSYDANQGVCSAASETSGGSGGTFGSNGSAGGSCSMSWGPGAGSGGSGQGNTTCEFDEGTTSGCMAGVKSYSSGGHGKSGSSVSANSGNGGGRNSAGSSGIIIMRSTSVTNVVVNDEVIGTYNGKVKVVESGDDYKITFYTSGSFILNKSLNADLFLVGGGGGGNSGGGGGGYTKTYLNETIEAGTYEIKIGNGGNVSSNGGITYFGTEETYFANGGNASSSYNGGSGGSGGGGRGGTCCVSYDANQGVCSSASETSGGSGGTFGSNGSAGGSCSMNWGPGAGSGGSGQGNTTCEFGEGTTSGCNSGITSYSKGGPGYVSSAIMNSGNGGGRNSAGASGILIIRNAR